MVYNTALLRCAHVHIVSPRGRLFRPLGRGEEALKCLAGTMEPRLERAFLMAGHVSQVADKIRPVTHVNYTWPKGRGFPVHRAVPVGDRTYQHSRGVLALRGSPGELEAKLTPRGTKDGPPQLGLRHRSDPWSLARGLYGLGLIAHGEGRADEARTRFEEARRLGQEHGLVTVVLDAQLGLALIGAADDPAGARRLLAQIIAHASARGATRRRALALQHTLDAGDAAHPSPGNGRGSCRP